MDVKIILTRIIRGNKFAEMDFIENRLVGMVKKDEMSRDASHQQDNYCHFVGHCLYDTM